MFKFVLFKEKLTCIYDEVIYANSVFHFYRYYDSATYTKDHLKAIKAKSLRGFLNRCSKNDSGYLYSMSQNRLHYHGRIEGWKFSPDEK